MRNYRGQTLDGKEWVIGYYYHRSEVTADGFINQHIIARQDKHMQMEYIQVTPESVGQSTGLKDKNEKEIYEGDIVEYDDGDNWETGREEVKFENGAFNCACYHEDYEKFVDEPRNIEVIGNITENPLKLLT